MAVTSPLDRYRDAELTLEDLVTAATRLLKRLDVRPDDGRVATEPDARGVRYYQGIGVLDRPLRYDSRRAVYGFRHLLQFLAVKRLQQEGHPLHLIQQSLAGRSTAALERALAVMLVREEANPARGPAREGPPPEPMQLAANALPAIEADCLAALGTVATSEPAPARVPDPRSAGLAAEPQMTNPAALIAARISPGVTITIDPALVADPDAVIAHIAGMFGRTTKMR